MGKATSSNCEEGRFAAGTKLLGMNSATSYFSSLERGQWLERLTNLRYGENPVSVTHPLDAMNGINLVLLNTRWGYAVGGPTRSEAPCLVVEPSASWSGSSYLMKHTALM